VGQGGEVRGHQGGMSPCRSNIPIRELRVWLHASTTALASTPDMLGEQAAGKSNDTAWVSLASAMLRGDLQRVT
jgi:hypothetical protein